MTTPRPSPSNLTSLTTRLRNHARDAGQIETRVRRRLSAVVVNEMFSRVPDLVIEGPVLLVKGGTALDIRRGAAPASLSKDFDAAVRGDLDAFLARARAALEAHWKPLSRDVARLPGPGHGRDNAALRLGFGDVEATTGWALSDTVAAAVYGAPVATRSDHPRDFYVPDQTTLRRAVQLLGAAVNRQERAGTVRVAPVAAACSERVDATTWADEEWPLAQPLFVALDLAQDPGRGREILDGWTPREQWQRVW